MSLRIKRKQDIDLLKRRRWNLRLGKKGGPVTARHPLLLWLWPIADAARLERERMDGDPVAMKLLGEIL